MTAIRDRAIEIYDAFTHEHRDRRTLLRQMTALAGSFAAAETMILGIAASPAAAAISDPADPKLVIRKGGYAVGEGRTLTGYFAAPRNARRKLGAVMVIHENRGLQPHIEDVARRIALAGFFAVAPDFLSPQGGTPANEDQAREMIGKVDYPLTIQAGVSTVRRLAQLRHGTGRVGVVGFCWGGALVDQVAVEAGSALSAAVSYYGPAPDPSQAARVSAPMMLHYASKDVRVAATGTPWTEALKAAGKTVEAFTYPNVDHAFNNDTSAERYDKAAADLAWGRTTAFFHKYLDV